MLPRYKSYITQLFALLLFTTVLVSCLSDNITDPPAEEDDPQISNTESVPADGILETVTWNIEWYGSNSRGPGNENLQTKNVLQVVDSLKSDLYAFQEISNQQELDGLTRYMTGYSGFIADYVSFNQKMAFVFNTETIDSVSSGSITQNQNGYDWASGRFPLYFEFDYTYQNTTIPIYAIAIHAKAFDDQESYNRRKNAAESLYNYLINEKPNAHIIFLGDFNDDMDVSIYNNAETPYKSFVDDTQNFQIATLSLSGSGASSTVGYDDMIDHIIFSDELFNLYIDDSENVFTDAEDFITNYGNTTSDHYPVISKFNITQN
ncbi:MAG: endonuclease/exonuclease/phosphatase family protein [Balneolaceae bacterium]|nr:endonuclease/exonuclease/phosphatase family protein [Balneolaceae bacterium]